LIAVGEVVEVGAGGGEVAVQAVCERDSDACVVQILKYAGGAAAGGIVQEVVVLELVAHGGRAGPAQRGSGAGQEATDLGSINEAGDAGHLEGVCNAWVRDNGQGAVGVERIASCGEGEAFGMSSRCSNDECRQTEITKKTEGTFHKDPRRRKCGPVSIASMWTAILRVQMKSAKGYRCKRLYLIDHPGLGKKLQTFAEEWEIYA
jgi:hypothetical protein